MSLFFKKIGIVGKQDHDDTRHTLTDLIDFLFKQHCDVYTESRIGAQYTQQNQIVKNVELNDLGAICDLIIVIGGDGNMLRAARVLAQYDTAVIGINRGNLGFLTDLDPDAYQDELTKVLQGNYSAEQRFLLEVEVKRDGALICNHNAVNEVVLHSDQIAKMMEFEVYINDKFVFSQRADGLIMSTPTGTTAYSLSGGGPILTPNIDAICLLPMFPHSLANRPLVVDADSTLRLIVASKTANQVAVTCDSHMSLPVLPGDEIFVQKHKDTLKLIHPKDYNYFNVLRQKLNWGSKLY